MGEKQKILIADDSEMNRGILTEILGDGYEVIEAENGREAVEALRNHADIDLLMLDIMMPEMDGFEVLVMMNKYHWIDDVPVIMISAENASAYAERAYDLGVVDYISRPFDMAIVRRRVINTLMLYAKQKRLMRLVANQVYEKEKSNSLMINILSHIVEFRNGESGLHVLHIHTATDLLLRRLAQKTDRYELKPETIFLINTASALHDIGKINIPEEILNKPGKLTKEEFDIMKTHTAIGADILNGLPFHQNDPLVRVAYQICRWHHERYDGRGYPDGLVGDEIPIAAQVVSMADVYDALTSERCYKKAFSHETAMHMILNGECGVFNPLLLECLTEIGDKLQAELKVNSGNHKYLEEAAQMSEQILKNEDISGQAYALHLLETEQAKSSFFRQQAKTLQFDYDEITGRLTLSEWGALHTNRRRTLRLPCREEEYFMASEDVGRLKKALKRTTPEKPDARITAMIPIDGEYRRHCISARTLWSSDPTPVCIGAVGQAEDISQTMQSRKGGLGA